MLEELFLSCHKDKKKIEDLEIELINLKKKLFEIKNRNKKLTKTKNCYFYVILTIIPIFYYVVKSKKL